jgi:hypothetical protein
MYTYMYIYFIHMCAYALPSYVVLLTSTAHHHHLCCATPAPTYCCSMMNERMQGSQEQLALQRLYDATNGDSWTRNSDWKTASDLNNWVGVTAINSTVVTIVELNTNNLAGGSLCLFSRVCYNTMRFHSYCTDWRSDRLPV